MRHRSRGFPALVARALLALATLCALPAAGAEAGSEDLRRAFAAAYSQAEAGAPAPAGGDEAALRSYPLYPYLQAARLRNAIAAVPATAVRSPVDSQAAEFLARHGAEPVARLVRRPWLAKLAARRQWQAFLDVYAQATAPDQALRCRALEARIALGRTAGLAEAATAEWLTPASADDACDTVFDWLRAERLLDDALIERRARLALEAGESRLARWLTRSLPEETARPLRDWALFLEEPRRALDAAIASPATAIEPQALLAGWTKLARRDPDAAAERYAALLQARNGDAALASRLAQQVALGMAWSRRSGALTWFARIAAGDYDELTYEWQARAAMWAGNWPAVAAAVAGMPATLRDSARWRYWAARAAEAGGDAAAARAAYALVIPSDNWFAVLAAARLEQAFAPHPQTYAFDPAQLAALEDRPGFARARELFAIGLLPLAQSEWNAACDALEPASQRAAIGLAAGWGWYFQAIATAARQGLFYDYELLYPRPYDEAVADGARLTGLSPTLIYAVLRQESLYQPWAVSAADAVGLMQLLPGTARRAAVALRRPRPTRASLAQPETNVVLGAATLATLVDRFDGQLLLALAGYNAGPGAVRRWLPDDTVDADVWVENIPYNETREYVQRVMWHSVVFKWLQDREPEDAAPWLARVSPVD